MAFFYSSVPLVKKKACPKASDHNRLASEFNKRLTGPGPASAWNIFYYADSIFLGMRNTATPAQPLGVSPPEDEWWKVYYNIELPTATTGEGNWPLALAGTPQGANVMNPLNAYIFGRVTSENKKHTEMGPWAEGNLFDGLVDTSRAVHSNSVFWASSFTQRGAWWPNEEYYSWRRKEKKNSSKKYLPSNKGDKILFSKSLFSAGRSSDKFHEEYASQHVYTRYPPAVYSGSYVDKYTGERVTPEQGILKRKNATKDILQWVLWAYTFYFRGNEEQRSLFCEKKSWDAPIIDFTEIAGEPYKGEQVYGEKSVRTAGPLTICDVGFDFNTYYSRQNILAPVLGYKKHLKNGKPAIDSTGNAKIAQYRPVLEFKVSSGTEGNKWLGLVNDSGFNNEDATTALPRMSSFTKSLENYDDYEDTTGDAPADTRGGKTIRFRSDQGYKENGDPQSYDKSMLFKFSYDPLSSRNEEKILNLSSLITSEQKKRGGKPCLAGYFLQTNGLNNRDFKFILRVWQNESVIHETKIDNKYSHDVNRNAAEAKPPSAQRGKIYNKMFYFKNPVHSGEIRFEVVPYLEDLEPIKGVYPGTKNKDWQNGLTEAAFTNYDTRFNDYGKDKIISFGNPYSSTVDGDEIELTKQASGSAPSSGYFYVDENGDSPSFIVLNSSQVDSIGLETGDLIKVSKKYTEDATKRQYADSARIQFLGIHQHTHGKKIYFGFRQDGRLKDPDPDQKHSNRYLNIFDFCNSIENGEKIYLEKMAQDSNLFRMTLEPAILLKQRPNFRDAYSLLRVVSAKKAGESNSLLTMAGFDPDGADHAGHGFYESNKAFRNYIKYGSAANFNGAEAVKALRQKVNYNPLYESARKFVSSYLRVADRVHLINYRVEGGKGVLYFRRFNPNLPKKAKSTIFDNMEPPLDPSGRFHGSVNENIDNLSSTRYKPILDGVRYYMHIPDKDGKIKYNGTEYSHGQRFTGDKNASYLEDGTGITISNASSEVGAYEIDSIRESAPYGGESNEWIMFMNSVHYKNGGIYKPSIYSDIMGFLNNRCHHRSKEYEQTYGEKYDMIREELMRTPTLTNRSRFSPGRRLQIFLSKSSNNYNYVFNTNNPSDGNLDSYGVEDYVKRYRASCPAVSQKPYRVKKCTLVHPLSRKDLEISKINPSYKKSKGIFGSILPANIIRVELDRPLSNTGRLSVGRKGYSSVDLETLIEEPYRTDENAVIEYLFHKNSGYNCKRMMLGDYGTSTEVHEGYGYRPQGACYPRFYFLKLIPKVGVGALLDTTPYAQMDFYLRAMASEFVSPFHPKLFGSQVRSTNWKWTSLASRSGEEDPTAYHYVDPREISGR